MRVKSVPGRLVRHPVTLRVIDEGGVLIDPHDLTWVNLIADGDVELVEDEPAPDDAPAEHPAETAPIAILEDHPAERAEAAPATEQE